METSEKVLLLKKGEDAARISTGILVMLSFAKGVVGFLSGSIALLADAIHSLSDIFASLAVWFGLRFAQKKPSEMFPYGFYRVETLALLVVSVIIVVSGVTILLESIDRIWTSYAVMLPHISITVASLSVFISFLLARYKIKVGESIGSQALQGEGKHSQLDAYSSIIVVVAIVFNYMGISWVEAVAGIVISLLILKLGLWMGKDSILVLLDVSLGHEQIKHIKEIAENTVGVNAVHALKMRRAGPYVFGEMHLEMDETLAVDRADEISRKVENKIKDDIREIDTLTIHIEPAKRDHYRIAIPIGENKGLQSPVHSHFGGSPYYIFIDIEKDKIKEWYVSENPGVKLEKRKGITVAHFLVDNNVDILVIKKIGEGPFHVLRDSMVKLFLLPENMNIKEIVNEFVKERLKMLETTTKNVHVKT